MAGADAAFRARSGTRAGRQVRAVLTDMDTPLGHMAGNSLEVLEALATLRGEGPDDLTELCVALAVEALAAQGWISYESNYSATFSPALAAQIDGRPYYLTRGDGDGLVNL